MFTLSLLFLLIFTILILLIIVVNLLSKKTFIDQEKNSPFECGFDPKSTARLPFSLQFFLIALIFLIFDVEITLLFPLIICLKLNNMLNYLILSVFFVTILLMGLYHEWKQNALNWTLN